MLEALWSVEFTSSFGFRGHGVMVLETGRVLGGDSLMIYIGDYKVENNVINATLKVNKYANEPGMTSTVGLNSFTLKATGKPAHDRLDLTGYVAEDPTRKMTITAVRRAELPNPN